MNTITYKVKSPSCDQFFVVFIMPDVYLERYMFGTSIKDVNEIGIKLVFICIFFIHVSSFSF